MCQRGSVRIDPWYQWAAGVQLAAISVLCTVHGWRVEASTHAQAVGRIARHRPPGERLCAVHSKHLLFAVQISSMEVSSTFNTHVAIAFATMTYLAQ